MPEIFISVETFECLKNAYSYELGGGGIVFPVLYQLF
jgi:hypothetical protein